jgi:oxygen-independent coproporphyrinogen-3 oxidase
MRPFGIYVHVPFCATRCGYCDFNTYTAAELGGGPSASLATYPALAIAEIGFARKVLGDVDVPVSTVFFGGGTPTLLPPTALGDTGGSRSSCGTWLSPLHRAGTEPGCVREFCVC